MFPKLLFLCEATFLKVDLSASRLQVFLFLLQSSSNSSINSSSSNIIPYDDHCHQYHQHCCSVRHNPILQWLALKLHLAMACIAARTKKGIQQRSNKTSKVAVDCIQHHCKRMFTQILNLVAEVSFLKADLWRIRLEILESLGSTFKERRVVVVATISIAIAKAIARAVVGQYHSQY